MRLRWSRVSSIAMLVAVVEAAMASPTSISQLSSAASRTSVQNAMWSADAFPTSPQLSPGSNLTLAYFNSTGGGRVTLFHLVIWGPPRELLRRHVAVQITYDDLPYPSVFAPVGDFFMEHAARNDTSTSSHFETDFLAFRPSHSWYSYFHMPYQKSLRIELVGSASLPSKVRGESWVQHDDTPWGQSDAYFHARFAYHPRLRFPWEMAIVSPPGGWSGPGQLVGLSMRFSAGSEWAAKFSGTFTHVCEGNWELYLDNKTALLGNDTRVNIAASGYQASDHVIVVTGSEDMFGYSFGWTSQQVGRQTGTPLWVQNDNGHDLATYRFFDAAPMRFTRSMVAQVNWGYDTGHNVPEDLCPPVTGCEVEYDVVSYLYLRQPANAGADSAAFPWATLAAVDRDSPRTGTTGTGHDT